MWQEGAKNRLAPLALADHVLTRSHGILALSTRIPRWPFRNDFKLIEGNRPSGPCDLERHSTLERRGVV